MSRKPDCPCRRIKCVRHGDCDACRAYHAETGRKYPVACEKETAVKEREKMEHNEEQRKIIKYFSSDDREYRLSQIGSSDWRAGQYLAQLLRENKLKEMTGDTAEVLMLVRGKELLSFCTLAPLDDIQPTELTPWIGFVYTFPEYRGHRYAGELLDHAEALAADKGYENVYISTGETGLYEKYGYEFWGTAKDIGGEDSRIYRKALN